MPRSIPKSNPRDKPKLLDQVRDIIRRKHFSIRTEQAYGWSDPLPDTVLIGPSHEAAKLF